MPTAYIGMGSNLASLAGPPDVTLAAAAARLEALGRVTRRSSLYSTEPVGFADQPRFINAVTSLETELSPQALLEALLTTEQEFGRDRAASFANGPRTLDLDILLYGNLSVHEPSLEIPHPRLTERAFVLIPLNEIAPDIPCAESGATVSQLLHNLHQSDKRISDEVVPIHSDAWRAGAGGGVLPPGAAPRPGPNNL